MPRIIDHDARRKKIAILANNIFRQYGYSGIGMRQIAEEMNMSKSALYHYYPSKEALFLACSTEVAQFTLDAELEPIDAILKYATEWESIFPGELRIILDYIGNRTPESLHADKAITTVMDSFSRTLAVVVEREKVSEILSAVFGFLLLRYFNGRITPWSVLRKMLLKIINSR